VQRRMMTTIRARTNVHALAIEGTFDDCQGDREGDVQPSQLFATRSRSRVSNSINWARIVAQVVYYFTSAVVALGGAGAAGGFHRADREFRRHFLRAMWRSGWGLPVRCLRIAANVNDILPRTLKTGIYEVREVHSTASPSMDIQVSSNFERLLFEAGRRDADGVRRLMGSLKQSGRFVLPDATLGSDPRGI